MLNIVFSLRSPLRAESLFPSDSCMKTLQLAPGKYVRSRRLHLVVTLLVLLSVLLAACGSRAPIETVTYTPTHVTQNTTHLDTLEIQGAGATFPSPIYAKWMYAYSFIDPSVAVRDGAIVKLREVTCKGQLVMK